MTKPVAIIVGIVVLIGVVLFIASLTTPGGAQLSVRAPAGGNETTFSLRYSEGGGAEPGFFTRTAVEINDFFADFRWYRDLSNAYFKLGQPLKILLNWIFGGLWALAFLGRRR